MIMRRNRELPRADPDQVETARRLRRAMSEPERVLWTVLRDRAIDGLKFRRQHPIGPFVADFYCAEFALAIEIDGSNEASVKRAFGTISAHWARSTASTRRSG